MKKFYDNLKEIKEKFKKEIDGILTVINVPGYEGTWKLTFIENTEDTFLCYTNVNYPNMTIIDVIFEEEIYRIKDLKPEKFDFSEQKITTGYREVFKKYLNIYLRVYTTNYENIDLDHLLDECLFEIYKKNLSENYSYDIS